MRPEPTATSADHPVTMEEQRADDGPDCYKRAGHQIGAVPVERRHREEVQADNQRNGRNNQICMPGTRGKIWNTRKTAIQVTALTIPKARSFRFFSSVSANGLPRRLSLIAAIRNIRHDSGDQACCRDAQGPECVHREEEPGTAKHGEEHGAVASTNHRKVTFSARLA